ncbi:hypothetical protein K437DRAFT_230765 [Tilletiaria anomala UBC 951]|uniref:Pre-mRNA-processing protein 45 n=1 Tax=Tilletiaria anomala (strain ATCC 24038 / CBS 436.72 / UBC 951) TaxID=1037660 RepID=A0A066WI29_TILAU|nr:uncharacterized protein K437DRAFT_230765 [Tilletiaria anomala UBC 951]KDN53471.1 hypothetical protein K437DRAFT_230765 [Tilletiaria anomala UBC 951]
MSSIGLASRLPAPRLSSRVEDVDDEEPAGLARVAARISSVPSSSSTAVTRMTADIPTYGQRQGWRPQSQTDFGPDGGAYPECHVAQYPLDMGKIGAKGAGKSGGALALQLDAEGNIRYDAIVQQGRRDGQRVQSTQLDIVPLRHRADYKEGEDRRERPSEEEVASVTERTRLALEKITQTKIKAAQPGNIPNTQGNSSFIRYTPGQQGGGDGKQRIIKMTEVVEDPLEPSRWKHKKVPRGPPSPPPPVLRSPPRKATAQELQEWAIPPSISNWKNNRGFTIPLDKRLATDGRGLHDVHINDGFAQFSEALNLADRHAREEVRQRAAMQQKLAAKEKAAKEEHLRMLAQRAREERAGIATPSFAGDSEAGPSGSAREAPSAASNGRMTAAAGGAMPSALAGYGSDSGESDSEDSEEEAAARERDRLRAERKRERERELRMSNMGTEQRAKMIAKEQNRDISEKIALGLAKPSTQGGELDARLFNRETFNASFGNDDSYNLYDKPLLQGSSAAQAIYSRPGGGNGTADDIYAGGTEEGIGEALKNDRFGLGKSRFEGADMAEERHGPVQFEKDQADPFAIEQFLDAAKRGTKRAGLELAGSDSRKKQRDDDE